MARLIDVAKVAGVSRSTVSNVFNTPDLVRPSLRKRVEAAARDLGYAGPDPKGRLLRAGHVNAIGVIPSAGWGVGDALRNLYFQMLLSGIAEVCDERGANLVLMSDTTRDGGSVRSAIVDGFIFSRVELINDVEPARLRRLPFVVTDVDAGPDINSVRADALGGCRDAAAHLLSLGHRRFAIMSFLRAFGPARYHPPGPSRPLSNAGMAIDQDKLRGYAEAFAAAGLSIDDVPIVQAHPWDRDAAGLLLDVAPEATAILSMMDMQAIAVLAEARRRGRDVPGDLSVVGYNNIAEAATASPGLTTVDGMGVEKGRIAAEIVFEGGTPRQEVLACPLVIRNSTGPAPKRSPKRSARGGK